MAASRSVAVFAERIASAIGFERLREFDHHALVSFATDTEAGLTSVIAVHRANPAVPSFGATRFWHYASTRDAVKDALRLSRLMSYKAALAGLECGGAKGVIIADRDPHLLHGAERTRLLEAYASRVNLLGGRFVTGTDVGITQADLEEMRRVSRHFIGFNDNSTEFTAIGVFESIRVVLAELFGTPSPEGRSFAIQGLGKVGEGILERLYDPVGPSGALYVSDIDPERTEAVKRRYPRVTVVSPKEIDAVDADVFVPCALSGAINHRNVSRITFKAVVGGANNQLDSESTGDELFARGILYAPDYVANAGGLIAVFDEYKHPAYDRGRVALAVERIPETLRKVIAASRAERIAPHRVANRMAEHIFNGFPATAV